MGSRQRPPSGLITFDQSSARHSATPIVFYVFSLCQTFTTIQHQPPTLIQIYPQVSCAALAKDKVDLLSTLGRTEYLEPTDGTSRASGYCPTKLLLHGIYAA
jgi:hypothetical protein